MLLAPYSVRSHFAIPFFRHANDLRGGKKEKGGRKFF